MTATINRDRTLTVVALVSWALYILGCASFSPDDSKVLFPSFDQKTGATVVAVYDRGEQTVRTLVALPEPEDESNSVVRPLWTPDGSRIVAIVGNDNNYRILTLPSSPNEAMLSMDLKDAADGDALVSRPAIVGSRLYLRTKNGLLRIDLENGAQLRQELSGDPVLIGSENRIFYRRELAGVSPSFEEFGNVNPETLALVPSFEIMKEAGPSKQPTYFAVSRDGIRFALPGIVDKTPQVRIFEGGNLRGTIPLAQKTDDLAAGLCEWSANGDRLYCAYRKNGQDGLSEFGIVEAPIDGGTRRLIPLFNARSEGNDDGDDVLFTQLNVSNDGKTLATASTYLFDRSDPDKLKPEDLALYLIDVSTSDGKVTKVPIPAPPIVKKGDK